MNKRTETLNDKDFAFLCFIVLMQNGRGIIDKSPSYIFEKIEMLNDGWDAFSRLDIHNQRKVLEWHKEWKVKIPNEIKKYCTETDRFTLFLATIHEK